MKTIILNEFEHAKEVIRTRDLGENPFFSLVCAGRYYFSQGFRERDVRDRLRDLANKSGAIRWDTVSDRVLAVCKRRPALDIQSIEITEAEIASVKKMEGLQRQRLLFTLLVLAKHGNRVREDNDSWVYRESSALFTLANISVSKKRQCLYVNDLMRAGAIRYNDHVNNLDLRVLVIDDTKPVAVSVYEIRDLGYQYMMHLGLPFFECVSCGALAQKKNNRQKYCTGCATVVNAQKTIERYHKKYGCIASV